jgi:hypothetical protein
MKAKWKFLLWTLAPLLVYTILYWLWIPGVLEYSAWKRGREYPTSEALGSALLGYFLLPPVVLHAVLFDVGLLYQTVFALLTAVWVIYFVKFHAEYMHARVTSLAWTLSVGNL